MLRRLLCQPLVSDGTISSCAYGIEEKGAYGFLELGIFFLGVDEVESDVECSGQHQGQEEGEPSQVGITLGAKKDSF